MSRTEENGMESGEEMRERAELGVRGRPREDRWIQFAASARRNLFPAGEKENVKCSSRNRRGGECGAKGRQANRGLCSSSIGGS